MPGQHVLVTGGCGFFGAWIVKRLLDDGDRVTVADVALFTTRWEMLMSKEEIARVAFVQANVDEPAFVDAVVAAAPDAIIHLAGLQMPTCRADPVKGAKVNVIGTLNVFEAAKAIKAANEAAAAAGGAGADAAAARRVPKIVYASSAAIFGPDAEYGEAPVGDMSAPRPSSHYGAFKLCGEFAARAYFLANGIPSVGLRPLTVYGPGRDQGLTSGPSRSIAASVLGQKFDISFSGPTVYIHIREIADIFVTCARDASVHDAKVYTVGGDTVDTKTFLAELVKAVPAASGLITISGGDLPIASKIDDAALRKDYPTIMRIPLAAGIAETVTLYNQMKAAGTLTV